tara:strand:- start:6728 stop:6889 length:162 start_codon:yes stop_codon:yes gene_type:complete
MPIGYEEKETFKKDNIEYYRSVDISNKLTFIIILLFILVCMVGYKFIGDKIIK